MTEALHQAPVHSQQRHDNIIDDEEASQQSEPINSDIFNTCSEPSHNRNTTFRQREEQWAPLPVYALLFIARELLHHEITGIMV